jgi:hypothetical protein
MRRYTDDQERRIRAQAHVRHWTRAKLLEPPQRAALEAELRVDLRRTNDFLRAGLALFAAFIVVALVALVVEGLNLDSESGLSAVTAIAAIVCIVVAETLVGRLRFYRFGVEEALAVASVLLIAFSGAMLAGTIIRGDFRHAGSIVVGLMIAAAGGLGLYRRFGYVYAAVGSMVCAAAIPFQLKLSPTAQHILAAAVLASAFVVVRTRRLKHGDEYPGDEYGQLQAAAWAAIYIALNLQIGWWDHIQGWFYWSTYVMTWVLPIVGLRWGVREKDRYLIDISIVMALVTLATNKPYLGRPRNPWDPILLGALLIGSALAIRRWLSSGPEGQRGGFTSARLLGKDSRVLTLLRASSTTFQPQPPAARSEPGPSGFDGGRSGGGGGGATY